MGRLTRDGTAETVSRDQILGHERGEGNIHFPVQLTTSRIGNLTRLIHTLVICVTIHSYSNSAIDLYTIKVYSLEHKQYNVTIILYQVTVKQLL